MEELKITQGKVSAEENKVVVITGPTATGKTALGVMLAKKLGGEVISADSMQIYKGMDIGTAKPTIEEMQGVVHHMFDVAQPWENYSVARYAKEAGVCADDILARGKIPVIVGGTGLYIEALLAGREFAENGDNGQERARLNDLFDNLGGEEMLRRLSEFDLESAARLHPHDKKRIVRAFEVYSLSGETISEHNRKTKELPPKYESCKIALTFENRQDLYDRINRRVDIMMRSGLQEEVERLLGTGIDSSKTAMQAIGYKEMVKALRGEITIEEAVEEIKMESRRYAKRQLSWLRRDEHIQWISWGKTPDIDEGLRLSTEFLKNCAII